MNDMVIYHAVGELVSAEHDEAEATRHEYADQFERLASYDVVKEKKGALFTEFAADAARWPHTVQEYIEHLDKGEIAYIEATVPNPERFGGKSKRSGMIKVSKYLDSTYLNAKGTITGAMLEGIELLDDNGKPKGKTKLEQERAKKNREEAEPKAEKTPEEKLEAPVKAMFDLLPKCDDPVEQAMKIYRSLEDFVRAW